MIIIDRFEEDIAVLETDEGMTEINRFYLPENAQEGDVLINDGEELIIDHETTEKRRNEMREKLRRLMNND